jgi:hypothetical protein
MLAVFGGADFVLYGDQDSTSIEELKTKWVEEEEEKENARQAAEAAAQVCTLNAGGHGNVMRCQGHTTMTCVRLFCLGRVAAARLTTPYPHCVPAPSRRNGPEQSESA